MAHYKLKQNFDQTCQNTTWAQNFRIVSAYRKKPNLQDILVRAKLPPPNNPIRRPTDHFARNLTTGERFKLPWNIPLSTSNCVYIIQCKKCPKQYVGETRNSLRTRLSQHIYNIKQNHKSTTHLVQHFRQHCWKNLILRGLEHDTEWTTTTRRKKERYWIQRLDTGFPVGLNEKNVVEK